MIKGSPEPKFRKAIFCAQWFRINSFDSHLSNRDSFIHQLSLFLSYIESQTTTNPWTILSHISQICSLLCIGIHIHRAIHIHSHSIHAMHQFIISSSSGKTKDFAHFNWLSSITECFQVCYFIEVNGFSLWVFRRPFEGILWKHLRNCIFRWDFKWFLFEFDHFSNSKWVSTIICTLQFVCEFLRNLRFKGLRILNDLFKLFSWNHSIRFLVTMKWCSS